MFNPLLEKLNDALMRKQGELIQVPHGLEECSSNIGNGYIKSWLWKVPGFRRWRVTRIDIGERLQVLNSVAYPDYTNEQPIMGIDLLWFGVKRKLVAVLDFQPLVQDEEYLSRYYKDLRFLKERYLDFNSSENFRSYDMNRYFSPWTLVCKGGMLQATSTLPQVFSEFIEHYLNLNKNINLYSSKICPKRVEELQNLYDIYSAEKDPAHGLFKSYFGKEWSDRFMHEFLFPQSSSCVTDHINESQ